LTTKRPWVDHSDVRNSLVINMNHKC